jgi:hypothetical protein
VVTAIVVVEDFVEDLTAAQVLNKFHVFFLNLKHHSRFEKTLPLDPILRQMNPLNKLQSHFVRWVLI